MDGYQPRRDRLSSLLSLGSIALLLLTILAGLLAPGCRDDTSLPIDRNRAPETILTGAPGDSQTAFYRVHLYWKGTDLDGEVVGYEWAVTESLPVPENIVYQQTTRTDSVFNLQVESNREVLGHRFYVRSIDNEGKRDDTPAWTFFAARNNCEPAVTFERAEAIGPDDRVYTILSTDLRTPSDTIPTGSSVRFSWSGFDCDVALDPDGTIDTVGHVTRFSHHLTPLEINDIQGSLTDTVATYEASRLRTGPYVMYVRAVDDAGFAGLDPSVRTFVWNFDPKTHWARVPVRVGGTDSMRGYWADTSGTGEYVPIADNDTLPIGVEGRKIRNRVVAVDPDSPNGDGSVASYEARLVRDSDFWRRLLPEPDFADSGLYSMDALMMCRSRDLLGRDDGTPDTLRIHVNKAIRFLTEGDIPDVGHFVQRPREGERIDRRLPPGSAGDTLILKFFGRDPDPIGAAQIRMQYRFLFYPGPNGAIEQDTNFSEWIDQGVYWAVGASFTARRRTMLPGDYVLEIQAEEVRDLQYEALGSRRVRKIIHFTLVN